MKVRCPGCNLEFDVGDVTYEVHEPAAGMADVVVDEELEFIAEEDGHRFPGRLVERDGKLYLEPRTRKQDDDDSSLHGRSSA